jgi:hypothetical protein
VPSGERMPHRVVASGLAQGTPCRTLMQSRWQIQISFCGGANSPKSAFGSVEDTPSGGRNPGIAGNRNRRMMQNVQTNQNCAMCRFDS